ncbi:MAG: hypothetical protein AAGJ97_12830, partial [Planctomycetota bacterium]
NEAPAFPEAIRTGGRYRGFGGLTTSSSGQTHFATTLVEVAERLNELGLRLGMRVSQTSRA